MNAVALHLSLAMPATRHFG